METIGLFSGVLLFSVLCLSEVRAGKCWLKVVPLKFDIVKKQQNFASFKFCEKHNKDEGYKSRNGKSFRSSRCNCLG